MLSVIVPTYNELDNIFPLYRRMVAALAAEDFEIVFVDDSRDGTTAEIQRLCAEDERVRLLRREQRGLASAVIDGLAIARGDLIAVIDADLQHPPEVLVEMLEAQRLHRADVVVPSRYIVGGDAGGLNGRLRQLLSHGGRLLAHLMLRESRETTDPMSGFFLATRSAVQPLLGTHPKGFKILLELLVRGDVQRVVDVPYAFAPREAECSKLGWQTQVDFLRQLLDLVTVLPDNTRFFLFALVGATGVAVNAAIFALMLTGMMQDLMYGTLLASLIASHAAMIWNFVWNTTITWRDRYRSEMIWRHALRYLIVSEIGAAVTAVVLMIMRGVGVEWSLLDQLIGIAGAVLLTYRLNDRWTYLREGALQPDRSLRR